MYDNPRSAHLSQFKVLLGDRVLAAAKEMGPATSDVSLWLGETTVETPRKAELSWPDDLESYSKVENGKPMVRLPLRFLKINDTVIWAGAGRTAVRNCHCRSKSVAVLSNILFRLHEWLARLSAHCESVRRRRL